MYLALRDLRHAKGRFGLIVGVVALMTLLVGFLSGLTGGLASQNISALMHLRADQVVFSMDEGIDPSYTASAVEEEQAEVWRTAPGVADASPVGLSFVLLEGAETSETVAVVAAEEGLTAEVPGSVDGVSLDEETASMLGVGVGDVLTLAGRELTVEQVVEATQFSHRAVVWTQLETWQRYLEDTRQPAAYASVLLVDTDGSDGALDGTALDTELGTTTTGFWSSLTALEAFKSEIGSLGLMIGMLVVIAVLVIGVFFLVWSMQRQRDISVLKALGADTGWIARDALGQALLVLLLGAGLGAVAALGLGWLAAQALPFVLTWPFLVVPAVGMVLAGLVGALVSLRQITRVDPLTALAAAA